MKNTVLGGTLVACFIMASWFFSPAAIAQAARLLAPYVGPIANVLAKRAAPRADSLRAFYLLLAEYVESKNDRASFLRAAGFPDA